MILLKHLYAILGDVNPEYALKYMTGNPYRGLLAIVAQGFCGTCGGHYAVFRWGIDREKVGI